jgi:Tfp pilus assembly protein PilX
VKRSVQGRYVAKAGRPRGRTLDPEAIVLKLLLIIALIVVVVMFVVPALRRRSGSRRGF